MVTVLYILLFLAAIPLAIIGLQWVVFIVWTLCAKLGRWVLEVVVIPVLCVIVAMEELRKLRHWGGTHWTSPVRDED